VDAQPKSFAVDQFRPLHQADILKKVRPLARQAPGQAASGYTKKPKSERDADAAHQRGMSVAQLLESRRRECEENLRLHEIATNAV
jgi:hypothetical protein